MKKITLLFTLLGLGWLVSCNQQLQQQKQANTSVKKISKYDRMDLAWKQEYALTHDPKLNIIPKDRLEVGKKLIEKQVLDKRMLRTTASNITWRERGPGNVGGRTRAILVDPNDASKKTVFSAGVSGGLWKTTDITAKKPVWTKVDDFFDNLAIVTIAHDPTNTNIIYFGTGEGWTNSDAVRGGGIWKTTDGGVSWSRTAFAGSSYVQKIAINSNGDVFAGTRSGLFKSTDKGGSWNQLTGLPENKISDVEIGSNDVVHVGMGIFTDGYYRYSSDGGATWNTPAGFPAASDIQRVELAVAPSNPSKVYAMMQGSGNGFFAGFLSTDGGANWTEMPTKPNDADTDISAADFTRSQAWYDLTIAVDPNNDNTIITGGIDLFKSTDGGGSWTQISKWSNNNLLQNLQVSFVHADHHVITYIDSQKILFGNDGGIYYSENGDQSVPTINSKEEGYNTSQFYSCAIHPTAGQDYFLGGTQDNGSHKIEDKLLGNSIEVTGGDGGFTHIDQDQPQYQFTSFINNNWFVSTDGGASFKAINHSFSSTGSFINPTDYDNDANLLYSGGSTGVFVRWNDPQSGNTPGDVSQISITAFGTARVTHVSVTPNTANRVFFGLDNGAVFKVDNANTASPTATQINLGSALPTGDVSVSCIAVEKGNDNHILVTYSNYGVGSVWETTDGGTTWFNVEGNLPDMPVRWVLFNPNNNKQALIATELGVWFTEEMKGVNTTWTSVNAGMANVRVDMLQIRESDNTVIAGTHGRGMFSTNFFAPSPKADFVVNKKAVYPGLSVQFTDVSSKAESWSWEFGDGTTSTLQNPTHSYNSSGVYNVKLTINGTTSTTINSAVHVLPRYGTPYTLAQGGNFETNPNDFASEVIEGTINPWERGTPANLIQTLNSGTNGWKTDLDANIVKGDYKAVLQTPIFNFSASGTYTVKFKMSMDVDACDRPYGAFMEYSTDNGLTWQVLGAANGNPSGTSNWYQTGPSKSGQSCGVNNVTDEQKSWSFDGNNVSVQYNASTLAGNSSVAFRFVYQVSSNYTTGYGIDGVMIDDFEITGPSNDASHFASVNASGATSFCDGDQVTLTANSGTGFTYQWQKDGVDITNATDITYVANAAGNYRVVVTQNSVAVSSNAVQVTVKASPLPVIQENGGTLSITAETGATYQWIKDGANISGATSTTYTPTECGSYSVRASYPNACQRLSALYDYNNINLNVSITASGNTLTASVTDGTLYTWFLDGNIISGATANTYTATEAGTYRVRVVKSGCPASSPDFVFTPTTGVDEALSNRLQLFPNPVNNVLRLAFDYTLGKATLRIVNTQGQVVKTFVRTSNSSQFKTDLDVSNLTPGTYILQIILEDGRLAVKRFYKQ